MNRPALEPLFRRGLAAWRLGRRDEAAETFRRVVAAGSDDPRHLSFHGLATVVGVGDDRQGVELCERAALLRPDDPTMQINLARARAAIGRRAWAIAGLRRALGAVDDRAPLLDELNRLSPRRGGPLAFLGRGNPLNRALGRLQRGRTGAHRTA